MEIQRRFYFISGCCPDFINVTHVSALDIVGVGLVSAAVPFCGNIILVAIPDRASLLIVSQSECRRRNVVTGVVLFLWLVFFFRVTLAQTRAAR